MPSAPPRADGDPEPHSGLFVLCTRTGAALTSPSPGLNYKERVQEVHGLQQQCQPGEGCRGRLGGIKAQSEEPTTEGRDQHWPRWGISPLG